ADANLIRYQTREYHANAQVYRYLYRPYDPHLQRWLNRDPAQEWGGINLYGFVGNSPLNELDADGLLAFDPDFLGPLQPGYWYVGGWSLLYANQINQINHISGLMGATFYAARHALFPDQLNDAFDRLNRILNPPPPPGLAIGVFPLFSPCDKV